MSSDRRREIQITPRLLHEGLSVLWVGLNRFVEYIKRFPLLKMARAEFFSDFRWQRW